jgi:hypothetical protein
MTHTPDFAFLLTPDPDAESGPADDPVPGGSEPTLEMPVIRLATDETTRIDDLDDEIAAAVNEMARREREKRQRRRS